MSPKEPLPIFLPSLYLPAIRISRLMTPRNDPLKLRWPKKMQTVVQTRTTRGPIADQPRTLSAALRYVAYTGVGSSDFIPRVIDLIDLSNAVRWQAGSAIL